MYPAGLFNVIFYSKTSYKVLCRIARRILWKKHIHTLSLQIIANFIHLISVERNFSVVDPVSLQYRSWSQSHTVNHIVYAYFHEEFFNKENISYVSSCSLVISLPFGTYIWRENAVRSGKIVRYSPNNQLICWKKIAAEESPEI